MTLAIETQGLWVRFGPVVAVEALDLSVESGEVFGFLGPNGAGKTTTIRVLLDLLRPDEGNARLLGTDVVKGGGELRSRVGFLPGDLALFPDVTGDETLDLLARLQARPATRRHEVLERLGFGADALHRKVATYSTGMRQKIGIASAFQHDPELLILDEPTTGLDPLVRDRFLELVRARAAEGRTVVLSSHVLDEVERCADRVGLLHEGRLHLVESVAALRAHRPRRVRLRYADGRRESFTTTDPAHAVLDWIPREGLADVEIRPASLDEVFRGIVDGDGRDEGGEDPETAP